MLFSLQSQVGSDIQKMWHKCADTSLFVHAYRCAFWNSLKLLIQHAVKYVLMTLPIQIV